MSSHSTGIAIQSRTKLISIRRQENFLLLRRLTQTPRVSSIVVCAAPQVNMQHESNPNLDETAATFCIFNEIARSQKVNCLVYVCYVLVLASCMMCKCENYRRAFPERPPLMKMTVDIPCRFYASKGFRHDEHRPAADR